MLTYMEQMDAELARTSIGDSFEKVGLICSSFTFLITFIYLVIAKSH